MKSSLLLLKKRTWLFISFVLFTTTTEAQQFCSHYHPMAVGGSSISPGYSSLQDCYDVGFYDLDIEASDTSTFIKGRTRIYFESLSRIDTLVFELAQALTVDSVFLNGKYEGNFEHENDLLCVYPKIALPEESYNSLEVKYSGSGSSGGFFSGINNRRDIGYNTQVTYTLSEPFQSSSWFPVKQNLSDKADSVSVQITTDSGLMAGSNGLLKSKEILPDGRIKYHWESKYPIAYYLISIAVADYLDYSYYVNWEDQDDSLLVQNFIYDHPEILNNEKEKIDKTGDMLLLFSSLYGEYPFKEEKYGHCMAPMGGGMEHQTMTTLQTFNFDLVSHELAHQWFGDNVTCGSWQDIWINEGFASYGEYLAREFIQGLPAAVKWMENAHDVAKTSREGSIYLTEDEAKNVSRIFSFALSYKKGAAILHMLRNEINDDTLFFRIFREFQSAYQDSVALADDFLNTVNQVTGDDYSWFFDQWYYGKGFPIVQATWKQRYDSLFIDIYQGTTTEETGFFRMHLDFLIEFSDGSDTLIRTLIDEPEKSLAFHLEKKMVSIQIDPLSKILMTSTIYEYIPENKAIEVSPNPFRDVLYLNFQDKNSVKSVLITNLKGQVIYDSNLGEVRSAELDLANLTDGIYLMVIKYGNERNAMRIVKL